MAVLRSQSMWLQNIQEASANHPPPPTFNFFRPLSVVQSIPQLQSKASDDFMSMPGEPTNFTKFSDFMSALPGQVLLVRLSEFQICLTARGLRVIMDCTPSEEPADLYEKWLAAGWAFSVHYRPRVLGRAVCQASTWSLPIRKPAVAA